MQVMRLFALTLLVHGAVASAQPPPAGQDEVRLERFERAVDGYRTRLKIPGLSAVIVKDQSVIWAKGYGFADLENRVPATPDTLYHIASITKTFGATLVMQLVEQGKLDLDEPASRYSSDFTDDSVRVKHLLSHTASGTPGERFEYDGANYDYVSAVIEKKTGKAFVQVVVETFFDPLGMTESVPYHDVVKDADKWKASLGEERLDRYRQNLKTLAQPYGYYGAGEIVHSTYPPADSISAAAGLLSTVRDLAKYDVAIDRHEFLRKDTQERAWTPFVSNGGSPLPYGLGWFVTDWHGSRLVWHYGQWGTGFSAMYLKVPERNVSLVMLSNSEALAGTGFEGVTRNVFVCSFLEYLGDAHECEPSAEAELAKWVEQRRSEARMAVPVRSEILDSYVGQYQFEGLENRIYTITRDGDRLLFNGPGGPRMELFAESETKFFLKIRPYRLLFTRPAGQPPQLTIVQDEYTFHSRRIR
jgi:CubicO group peptidase (beta-lactamase class C family)